MNAETPRNFGERFMMAKIPWVINLWKPFDRRVPVLLCFDVDFVEVVLTIIDIITLAPYSSHFFEE